MQTIEGYEDSTVKGTIRVIDAVFDSVEDWYGEGKLIQAINEYTAPVSEEYRGTSMLRMDSEGAYPRIELNKDIVKTFIDEGKTLTLVFKLGNVDGDHKTYVGNKGCSRKRAFRREICGNFLTPEKWNAIEEEMVAENMERIYVVTLAHVEGGGGGENSDPFTMYLAGYKLS